MTRSRHLIFVSYRGSDRIWATETVYARLVEAFGDDAVFKAGNDLAPGDLFAAELIEKAASCPVMLVCIGPDWLDARNPDGTRRLYDQEDWVRREIAIALRSGNRVVPVLFGGPHEVAEPPQDALPYDIKGLIAHQAVRLVPGGGLDRTVPHLVDELAAAVPELAARRAAHARNRSATEANQQAAEGSRGARPAVEMHHVSFGGDNVIGDKNMGDNVSGDKVMGDRFTGDKFTGDKVMGDKIQNHYGTGAGA